MKKHFSLALVLMILLVRPCLAQFNITTNTTNTAQTTSAGTNQVQAGVILTLNGASATAATVTIGGAHTFNNFGTTSSSREADTTGEFQDAVLVTGANAIISNSGTITQTGNTVNGAGARTNNAIRVTTTGTGLSLTNTGTISTTGTNNGETLQTIFLGATGATITNSGTIQAAGTGGSRAIEGGNSDLGIITITNNSAGLIQSATDDAIRIRSNTTFNLINSGNIIALNPGVTIGGGQALDLTSAEGGTLLNSATGLIRADGHDAVRLGSNMTFTNLGTIRGNSTINDSSANNVFNLPPNNSVAEIVSSSEGLSFEDGVGSTLINSGSISGSRHGVESGTATNVTITNNASGIIIGRNGSGIGFDTTSASAANVVVNNSGLIRGDFAGVGNVIDRTGAASFTNDGDGDGIDIDGAATINNFASGQIISTAANGFDTGGRANNSEGISIGGGIIINSGTIRGANRGILVNNDSVVSRSGNAATTITNNVGGVIEGQNGFAIRLENKGGNDGDTITNFGTITGTGAIPNPGDIVLRQNGLFDPNSTGTLDGTTFTGTGLARFIRGDGSAIQMGEGNDTLDNSGTITSSNGRAVNLEGGNDTMIVRAGSRITGLSNGGSHTTGDTLDLRINGLTAQKILDLQAGLLVNIGGMSFQNFELISGSTTSKSYASLSTSAASAGVAAVLDNTTTGATVDTLALLDKVDTATDIDAAMEQLSPRVFESLNNITFNNSGILHDLVSQRMGNVRQGFAQFDASGIRTWDGHVNRSLQRTEKLLADIGAAQTRGISDSPTKTLPLAQIEDNRWGIFLNGNVVMAEQGATRTLLESDYTTAAFTLGMDYRVTDSFVLGFFGGYSHTDVNLDTFGSESEINSAQMGIFGTYQWKKWFLEGALAYGHNFYDNNRAVLGTSNTSETEGDQVSLQTRLGYDYEFNQWTLTPSLGLLYTHAVIDGFTEQGPAALNVSEDEADSFRSSLGTSLDYTFEMGWGQLKPEIRAAWVHEFLNDQRSLNASFVDNALPGTFSTSTQNPDRDFGIFGFGLTALISDTWAFSLDYNAEVGREEFVAHQLSGGVRYSF